MNFMSIICLSFLFALRENKAEFPDTSFHTKILHHTNNGSEYIIDDKEYIRNTTVCNEKYRWASAFLNWTAKWFGHEKENPAFNSNLDTDYIRTLAEISSKTYRPYDAITGELTTIIFPGGLVSKIVEYRSEIIIGFKGTSLYAFGYSTGTTSAKDKEEVNLLFSCSSPAYSESSEDFRKNSYFQNALKVLEMVHRKYPDRKFVLTGHSLGGVIAAYVSAASGIKSYVFSTPGDRYIFSKAGLPKTNENITHIGMCDDPVFRGNCNGKMSLCRIAGYNLETKCHSGTTYCIHGKRLFSVVNHRIEYLISHLTHPTYHLLSENGCTDCSMHAGDFYNDYVYSVLHNIYH